MQWLSTNSFNLNAKKNLILNYNGRHGDYRVPTIFFRFSHKRKVYERPNRFRKFESQKEKEYKNELDLRQWEKLFSFVFSGDVVYRELLNYGRIEVFLFINFRYQS